MRLQGLNRADAAGRLPGLATRGRRLDWLTESIDIVMREAMVIAAIGFLVGGIDDLLVDLVYWANRAMGRHRPVAIDGLPSGDASVLVVFVPAWQEANVIGAMLRSSLERFGDDPGYLFYVGVYLNDRATIDAVVDVAADSDRIRLVINPRPGPTTKADCLNRLWDAMLRDEASGGWRARAVVLHDAEDVVHPDELRVYRACLADHAVVQLPVRPLVDATSRWVSGHYIDEFAYAHGVSLVARAAIGAALPLAGVGCAIDRAVLAQIASRRRGEPFDATSLTEDYELGLMIDALGERQMFARVTDAAGELIAVREYFPRTLSEAVKQKARWMTGIALSGWDRMGWGHAADWREHWMRMRDRRGPIAVIILAAAYVALIGWGASLVLHLIARSDAMPVDPTMRVVLGVNAGLLCWRLAMRAWCSGRHYGWVEALLSVPRAFVSNWIALLAVRHALWRYVRTLHGAAPRWDKTAHRFPAELGAPR